VLNGIVARGEWPTAARHRERNQIHARLKPGGPFLLIDGCSDKNSARFEDDLQVDAAFGRRSVTVNLARPVPIK